MIKTRADLEEYLQADKQSLGFRSKRRPKLFGNEIWKFERSLRKYEYAYNRVHGNMGGWKRLIYYIPLFYYEFFYHYRSLLLGFTIPPNTFGKGLCIHHYGCIVVNGNAKIGNNCIIQQCVNIGQNYGSEDVPMIGDNVYIGPGAKIFGSIVIADGCAIGAGAVVTHDFLEKNSVIVGNPAHFVGYRKPGLE